MAAFSPGAARGSRLFHRMPRWVTVYIVAWRGGALAPRVELRPVAWCWLCGSDVAAVQEGKRPDRCGWAATGAVSLLVLEPGVPLRRR